MFCIVTDSNGVLMAIVPATRIFCSCYGLGGDSHRCDTYMCCRVQPFLPQRGMDPRKGAGCDQILFAQEKMIFEASLFTKGIRENSRSSRRNLAEKFEFLVRRYTSGGIW